MAAHFSDGLLDQIRDANDIVDLISEYLPLKKRGKNFLGLCPFHAEKDPSFTVTPDKQIFYCFGCGEGGNVISFLMKHEKLSFPEAVKLLAKRANIPLPKDSFDEKREKQLDALYYANQVANEYFVKNLNHEKAGKRARQYLGKRGFEPETQKLFSLGYAPGDWEGLIRHARTKGMETETLNQAGLAVPRTDKPGHYDRFRNRITFPIYNLSGKIVGFGSRVLDDKDTPKYLNSPETPIYQKGKILYGLNLSKDAIRQKAAAILVEGNVDLITLYQAGITNVVAASGTAFTSDQARLLSRYAEKVYLFFDADSAGQSATIRSVDLLFSEGVEVFVVMLEAGHDPDSFVRKFGADIVLKQIKEARHFVDFRRSLLARNLNELSARERENIILDMVDTGRRILDDARRSDFLKKVAHTFEVEEAIVLRLVGKGGKASPALKKGVALFASLKGQEEIERRFLRILMEDAGLLTTVASKVTVDNLSVPTHRQVFQLMLDSNMTSPVNLMQRTADEFMKATILQIAALDPGSAEPSVLLQDHVAALDRFRKGRRRKSLKDAVLEAEQKGDELTAKRLSKELHERLEEGLI